ncbi:MAG TPA: chemotaxis-specific protein-glutamate methyltransferase CheB [Myxococcales bacterium]|jgi:two-component system chemotaxis response regulator CheB
MNPIRVLVVDDSAFARKVVREVLTSAGLDVLGIARDGLEALEKIAALEPDVVTLDLVMPNLDGLGVLAALPKDGPRVVVVSMAGEDSALGLAALEAGAVEIVQKPTALAIERLYEMREELVAAVTAAAASRVPVLGAVQKIVERPAPVTKSFVAIGASTGGPQALSRLIKSLPANFPVPVAVVVHLPPGYTQSFAERLNGDSDVEVVEAAPGLELLPGRVMIARAGVHLKLGRTREGVHAVLSPTPGETLHRPSVDVLFESAAEIYAGGVLGVVLTGMGDDGTRGSRKIHEAGGEILTEAESSCVVYGMPRCVVEAGLSRESVRIEGMTAAIVRHL